MNKAEIVKSPFGMTFVLAGMLLSSVLTAAEPETIAPVKAWRRPAVSGKSAKQTFAPVLKDDSIRFGNKTVKLSRNGNFECTTPEYGVIMTSQPGYFWLKEKGTDVWNWQSRNFDPKKSKFTRSGRKYTWELWYGDAKTPAFCGITQTLEVLPDDRIMVTTVYSVPEKTADRVFVINTHALFFPDSVWMNSTLDQPKQQLKLNPELKKLWGHKRKTPRLEWILGKDDPAKCISIQAEGKFNSILQLTRRTDCRDFFIRSDMPKNHVPTSICIDLRKGNVPEKNTNLRCGADLMRQENLLLPDNRHKNLIENSSFERGLEGWHNLMTNRLTRDWDWKPFELDDQAAYEGKHSLRMETRPGRDNLPENANIGPMLMLVEPGTYTLSFYAKGEKGRKSYLVAWLPKHVRASYPLASNHGRAIWKFPLTDQWKRYQLTCRLNAEEGNLFPCFIARDPDGQSLVWLDAVQLEKGGKATAYESRPAEGRLLTSARDNFFSSKEKIDGRFRITTAKPNAEGNVRITVKTFYGDLLLDEKKDFRTGADRTAEFPLGLDSLPGLGVFVVKAEYELKDGTRAYDFRRYAKIEFQNRPRPNKKMFGVDYGEPAMQYTFPERLKRWNRLGVGGKHWAGTLEKEEWDLFEKYDVLPLAYSVMKYVYDYTGPRPKVTHFYIPDPECARELRKNAQGLPRIEPGDKTHVLVWDFHLEPGGKLTPDYLKKVEKAAEKWSARFPFVRMWCFGGELTCKMPADWWGTGATDHDVARIYAQYLKAFADGIRKGNPKAKVFQDCPSNMTPSGGIAETKRLLAECNKLGVRFDVIAIHPYRYSPENPDLDSDTQKMLEMLKQMGYDKVPVLWSEGMHWGPYDVPQWGLKSSTWVNAPTTWRRGAMSYDMGWTEKKSAAWYARAWLVALKYSDRIIGATSGQYHNNFAMDVLQTPYAAQLAPNTLCAILGDAKFKKDIRFAPYIRAYVFEDAQKRPVAAVWCHNEDIDNGAADAPVVSVDFGNSLECVLDLMNTPRKFAPGKVKFAASPFPLFFRGKPGTLKQLTDALEKAELVSGSVIAPVSVSVNPETLTTVKAAIRNYVSREFSCELNGRKVKVPSAGQGVCSLPLSVPLKTDAIVPVELPVTLKMENGTKYHYDFKFEAFAAKRVSDQAELNTLDWSALPEVPFTRKIDKAGTSGTFRIGWNPLGIFLEAKIRDAKFIHNEYPTPTLRWNNDCLQIYFDTFANARQRNLLGYDEDDYDYAIFPNSKGTSAQVFRYLSVESQLGLATQAPPDKTFAPDIPCTFTSKDGVLTYRVFFPAKYLLPMKLQKGWVFGFGLLAMDSNQSGKVDGALTLASDGQGCYNRPHTWPAVILTE